MKSKEPSKIVDLNFTINVLASPHMDNLGYFSSSHECKGHIQKLKPFALRIRMCTKCKCIYTYNLDC